MSNEDIIRAWKDDEYRSSLSEEARALLPEHPAGLLELRDEDLGLVAGGIVSAEQKPSFCCQDTK